MIDFRSRNIHVDIVYTRGDMNTALNGQEVASQKHSINVILAGLRRRGVEDPGADTITRDRSLQLGKPIVGLGTGVEAHLAKHGEEVLHSVPVVIGSHKKARDRIAAPRAPWTAESLPQGFSNFFGRGTLFELKRFRGTPTLKAI